MSAPLSAPRESPIMWDAESTIRDLEQLDTVFWTLADCQKGVKVSVETDGRMVPSVTGGTQKKIERYLGFLNFIGGFKDDSAWGKASVAVKAAVKETAEGPFKGTVLAPLSTVATDAVVTAGSKMSLESAARTWSGDTFDKTALGIEAIAEKTVQILTQCQQLASQVLQGTARVEPEQSLSKPKTEAFPSGTVRSLEDSSTRASTPPSTARIDPSDLLDLQMHVEQLERDYGAAKIGLGNLQETYANVPDKQVKIGIIVGQFEHEVHPLIEKTSQLLNKALASLPRSSLLASKPPSPPPSLFDNPPETSPVATERERVSPSPLPPSVTPSPPASLLSLSPLSASSLSLSETPPSSNRSSPLTDFIGERPAVTSISEAPSEAGAVERAGDDFDSIGIREAGTRKGFITRLFDNLTRSLKSLEEITPKTGKVMFEYSQDLGSRFVPSISSTTRSRAEIFGGTGVWLAELASRKWYQTNIDSTTIGILAIRYEIINACNYYINEMEKMTPDEIGVISRKIGDLETSLEKAVAGLEVLKTTYKGDAEKMKKIQLQKDRFAPQIQIAINRVKNALDNYSGQSMPLSYHDVGDEKGPPIERREEKKR